MHLIQRFRRLLALTGASVVLAAGTGAIAGPPINIRLFDAPGAGQNGATQQGTVGIGINDLGVILGITRDDKDTRHGFLRHPDGRFTIFNAPNAGTGPGQGTRVGGINTVGAVAGTYRDASGLDHPYLRDIDGHFITITPPNLLGGNGWAVNLWGAVVGNYLNSTDDQSAILHYHAFVRQPNGTLTLFDPPGSTNVDIPQQAALNLEGAVTGDFWTCNTDFSLCAVHGFIRRPNGRYTVFDVPGAGPNVFIGGGTFPQAINDLGDVAGYYVDVNNVYHGFIRSAGGAITLFDVPTTCTVGNAPPPDCAFNGTYATALNNLGKVAGTYWDEQSIPHGFWREANGRIVQFDPQQPGTYVNPTGMNDWGQITGVAYDPNGAVQGLLVNP